MDRFFSASSYRVACLSAIRFLLVLWLFPLATEGSSKPSGKLRGILTAKSITWIEIKADGERLWVSLNGELITTATSIKNPRGHIGIQGELGLLEFRKISVEPL